MTSPSENSWLIYEQCSKIGRDFVTTESELYTCDTMI